MAFTPAPHTPFQWQNAPSTQTPLDSADLGAAEADIIAYAQAQLSALAAYFDNGTSTAVVNATGAATGAVPVANGSGGYAWQTAGSGVASVFGRSGAVAAQTGDYTAAQVTNALDKSSGSTQTISGSFVAATISASGITGALSATTRYVGSTAAGAPTSGTFVLGDWVVDQAGSIWVCTVGGSPGTWSRRVFRVTHTWAITGVIQTATGAGDLTNYVPPMFISLASLETVKLVKAYYVIGSGTSITFSIQRNGTNVTGLASLSATSTPGNAAASSPPTLSDGDQLALVVNSVSGTNPGNLTVSIALEHS